MIDPRHVEVGVLVDDWSGLYKESWTGIIVPEAFAHPAKYSRALIRFIYQHVIDCGWIKPGDSVCDPFGGVALGGFDALQNGLHWTGCELEEKFVGLGNQNIALWNERFSRMPNWGSARLIQGDSRQLSTVLDKARLTVSSPPYCEGLGHGGAPTRGAGRGDDLSLDAMQNGYGSSKGQLGAMKEGVHAIAITSPPYNPPMSQDHNGSRGGSRGTTPSEKGAFVKYGNSEGQLEGMSMEGFDAAIASPPFPQLYQSKGGERSEGNLETMDADGFQAAISSPPYEGNEQHARPSARDKEMFAGRTIGEHGCAAYGEGEDNLGNQRGEDFWSASRIILEQLHQVIVPGGHAVFVVKSFVRNKQIVDFPGQWAQLCEAVGFRLLHDHHALLTEHYGTQQTMNGEDKHLTVARKSFFRRLAESKGSPKIDYENVLCFERPL